MQPAFTKVLGFSLLNYLSVEVEYFDWPYSPSLYKYERSSYTLPRPIIPQTVLPVSPFFTQKAMNWKWSLNFRKIDSGIIFQ